MPLFITFSFAVTTNFVFSWNCFQADIQNSYFIYYKWELKQFKFRNNSNVILFIICYIDSENPVDQIQIFDFFKILFI